MKYAIDFTVFSENSTLRGNLGLLVPSEQDGRVFKEEYTLYAGQDIEERYRINGNIKCHNKTDVDTVLNNLIQMCISNGAKIGEGSFIALGEWMHDEPIPTKCSRTILWSK